MRKEKIVKKKQMLGSLRLLVTGLVTIKRQRIEDRGQRIEGERYKGKEGERERE